MGPTFGGGGTRPSACAAPSAPTSAFTHSSSSLFSSASLVENQRVTIAAAIVGHAFAPKVLATKRRDPSGSRTHASRTFPMDLSNPSARTRASRSVPARSAHAFAHSHATDAVDASIEPSAASFNTFDKCNHAAANAAGSEPTLPSLSTANDRSSRAVRSVWMASWSESAADVSDRARSLARRSPSASTLRMMIRGSVSNAFRRRRSGRRVSRP